MSTLMIEFLQQENSHFIFSNDLIKAFVETIELKIINQNDG